MKIAQIANIWQSIPPKGYGGTERVIFDLCEGLTKKGHDVTLFATGDSKVSCKLSSIIKEKLSDKNIPWSSYLYPLLHFTYAYEQIKKAGDFDIIHGHYSLASDLISLSLAQSSGLPALFIAHCPLEIGREYEDRGKLFEYCKNISYVSISDRQRTLPLNYIDTIYHGIDYNSFSFTDSPAGDYLVWLGRIVPIKGLECALEVADKLEKKIEVIGHIDRENIKNFEFFNSKIKSKLDNPLVDFVETDDRQKRDELLKNGKCLLFPICWEEPFGLVMTEAMSCGTPIVAFAQGSVPEIVRDSVTGFVVNLSEDDKRGDWIIKKTGIEGMVKAVKKIYEMPDIEYRKMRQNCRKHVEQNFTVEKMVDGYEAAYQKVIVDFHQKH